MVTGYFREMGVWTPFYGGIWVLSNFFRGSVGVATVCLGEMWVWPHFFMKMWLAWSHF